MSTIVVKKVKKGAHGHHGGAWKIAYADFVTAMMAFFLLMWLISMTTPEQKTGLAEYFAPGATTLSSSGAGGMLSGTAVDNTGKRTPTPPDTEPNLTVKAANFSAMASLRQALQTMPDIAELSHNVVIEPTKDGVDVSLVDENGRSMFREGSVAPYDRTRRVLEALAPALRQLPNRLSIAGYTATVRPGSAPAAEPWNLTIGRAIAVREILSGAGVPNDNFSSVVGRADTEPVFPDDPYIASNRRVTITLLNTTSPAPPGLLP